MRRGRLHGSQRLSKVHQGVLRWCTVLNSKLRKLLKTQSGKIRNNSLLVLVHFFFLIFAQPYCYSFNLDSFTQFSILFSFFSLDLCSNCPTDLPNPSNYVSHSFNQPLQFLDSVWGIWKEEKTKQNSLGVTHNLNIGTKAKNHKNYKEWSSHSLHKHNKCSQTHRQITQHNFPFFCYLW